MGQYRTEQERIDALTLEIKNPNVVGSGYIQHPPQRPFQQPLQMQPPTVALYDFPEEYSEYRSATGRGRGTNSRGQPRRVENGDHQPKPQGHHANTGKAYQPAQHPHENGGRGAGHAQHRPRPTAIAQPARPDGAHRAAAGPPRAAPGRPRPAAAAVQLHTAPQPRPQPQPQPQRHVPPAAARVPPPAAAAASYAVPVRPVQAQPQPAPQPRAQPLANGPVPDAGQYEAPQVVQAMAQLNIAKPAEPHETHDNGDVCGDTTEGAKPSKSQAKRLRKKKREGKI